MDRLRLPGDLEVYHRNLLETAFLYSRIFEDEIYVQHGIALPRDACMVDVGANIGLAMLFVHRRCPDARILAFEPIPATFDVLRANADLHRVNARLFCCALFDAAGSVGFRAYAEASVSSGAFPDTERDRGLLRAVLLYAGMAPPQVERLLSATSEYTPLACPVRPLSDVIDEERLDRIDLLKVVAEKSEVRVLDGIREADWPKVRQAVVEVHDIDGRLPSVRDRFRSRGFAVETVQEPRFRNTHVWTLFAVRPS